MTNSIHRVSVKVTDYQELDLTGPPISVAADRGGESDRFDLWFEHMAQPSSFGTQYHGVYPIWVFGTGGPIPWTPYTRDRWHFLGTIVTPSGLVWHVYYGGEAP